jgi:hypothetical protein
MSESTVVVAAILYLKILDPDWNIQERCNTDEIAVLE